MKTLVVYMTLYGNTRRLAETIAETLDGADEARAIPLDQLTAAELEDVDLVVMGSPTHYQSLPRAFRSALKALPKGILRGKSVAAFDTSVKMWPPLMFLTAAHRLLAMLRKLGGKRMVPPETFLVEASEVRDQGEIDLLCDGEIERAKAWAGAIRQGVQAQM
jgi:flavodoxin